MINHKIYIGVHSSKQLEDSYLGSGIRLLAALEKYGSANFLRSNLEIFSSSEEAYRREAEIVNEEFLQRNDVYNLKLGGYGGYQFAQRKARTPEAISKRNKTRLEKGIGHGSSNTQFGKIWITHSNLGNKKIHPDEFIDFETKGWSRGRRMPEGWGANISSKLKGKTLSEIHGSEKAIELLNNRKMNRKKK